MITGGGEVEEKKKRGNHFFIAWAICCSACDDSSAKRTPVLALCFMYFSQHLVTHCLFFCVYVLFAVRFIVSAGRKDVIKKPKTTEEEKSYLTFSSAGSISFLRNESTQSLKQRSTSELYMRRLRARFFGVSGLFVFFGVE